MKIIHTSDWHLGLTLHRYERLPEQKSMMEQIALIAADHQVDAIVISGDVFNVAQPSAQAQKAFSDALIGLRRACPDIKIVVTAGNHDSGSRHEAFSAPWQELGVTMIGNNHEGLEDGQIVDVNGRGFIVAVPYTNERMLPDGFYQQMLDRVASRNPDGLPVVLMAHTSVQGCKFRGHSDADDRAVGGIDYVGVDSFGSGFDYLALGHIHVPQTLSPTVRYSGSPLAVSFDEDYQHSVSLVTIDTHGSEPVVEEIPIDDPCPLITIPADGFCPLDEALRLYKELPKHQPGYVRLNVEVDDYLSPDAEQRARDIAAKKDSQFCIINARRRSRGLDSDSDHSFTVDEFKEMPVIEVARLYLADKGIQMDDQLRDMLTSVISECHED